VRIIGPERFLSGSKDKCADTTMRAGKGALSIDHCQRYCRSDFGPGNGPIPPFLLLEGPNMNADAIHAALGFTFTAIWLLAGQIMVGNR
jgi:hypothetical protein